LNPLATMKGKQTSSAKRALKVCVPTSKKSQEEFIWIGDSSGRVEVWLIVAKNNTIQWHTAIALPSSADHISSMIQHPDQGVIIGADRTLIKLHPQSLRELHRNCDAHDGRINCLSLRDQDIISASNDASIGIWNYKLDPIRRLRFHDGPIFSIALFDEAKLLATGGSCRRMYLTKVDALDPIVPVASVFAHCDAICSMIGDGHCLLWSASADGQLKLWNLENRPL